MKTAVLIPCYNEAKTIGRVVADFKEKMPHADIYVYDNNSTDNTAELAEQAGAIVRYEHKQGKGNVVRTMFREVDADCYVMVDGDDTYPADFGPRLEQLVLSGKADMAVGDRLSSTYFTETLLNFFCGVILSVLKKQHRQNFERQLTVLHELARLKQEDAH